MNSLKQNKLRYIILIALVLLVAGAIVVPGLYSRYTSNGTGSDSSRVAKWSVDVTDEVTEVRSPETYGTVEKTLNKDNKNVNYRFNAKNQNASGNICEVLTNFKVEVTLPKELPEGVVLELRNTPDGKAFNYDHEGLTYTFTNNPAKEGTTIWQFEPAKAADIPLYLCFSMSDECSTTTTLKDIQVAVTYEQANS